MDSDRAQAVAKAVGASAAQAKTQADAAFTAIDAADSKAPLSSVTGKRWVGKCKDWLALASTGAGNAKKAADACVREINAGNLPLAAKKNVDCTAFLGSALSQSNSALDWLNMMLGQSVVTRSSFAKGCCTKAKAAALLAQKAATEGRAGTVIIADSLKEDAAPPVVPPAAELSVLGVEALSRSVNEDAGQTLAFTVVRVGAAELPCSCTWKASGTASADDFIPGTAFEGTISWAAGEHHDQTVEFVLNPDEVLEEDESLTVTLQGLVGARLGNGSATTTILDDDSAPQGVELPAWPAKYTGHTYYVSTTGGAELSEDKAKPGGAQHALDNAASSSTIIFLGKGPYPGLQIRRTSGVNLKLISDVPAFTDLRNLSPETLTVADLDKLQDKVVVGKNLTASARLRSLVGKTGGYIWIEGFRSEFPDGWTMSGSGGGSTTSSTVGWWVEKCRMWQGNGVNLKIGPQKADGINKLNVVHKLWCVSNNEIGDPKAGGGTWQSSAGAGGTGTAICDYGVTAFQNTGQVHILESFFQMRANHFVSFKRGVGRNGTAHNRIVGNLFAAWNKTPSRMQTTLEIGQEQDELRKDYTTWCTDILNNTIADPWSNPFFFKNARMPVARHNRIIMHKQLIRTGLAGGNPGDVTGPMYAGQLLVADNTILDKGDPCQFCSLGNSTTITLARNKEPGSLIAVTTYDQHLGAGAGNRGPSPRVTVVRVDGDASGFAAPTHK